MAYVEQPYVNPYVGSIADLITRPAEARAHALEVAAAAQANAQQQRGQAWGGAINTIAQTAAAIPAQMQAQKVQAQEAQQRQLQIEAAQRKAANDQLVTQTKQGINALMSDPSMLNEDGTFNVKSIADKLTSMPEGSQGPMKPIDVETLHATIAPINQSIIEARDSGLKYQQNKANALAGLAAGALRLGKIDGNYFSHGASAIASAQKSGLMTEQEGTAALTHFVENKDNIPSILEDFVSKSSLPPIKVAKDEELVSALDPKQVVASNIIPPQPTKASLAAEANPGNPAAAVASMNAPVQPEVVQTANGPQLVDRSKATSVPILDPKGQPVKAPVPAQIQVNAAATSALEHLPGWATDDSRPVGPDANKIDPTVRMTPNGLYQAALNYISNGQYPPTGRGNDASAQAVRAAISSKVGAIAAASGMDEPALRAFYKSNAASLTQEQKMFDAAQANINTADRNVSELNKYLDKLPDTGSPLFNKPLRSFAKSVEGDPNMGPIATYLASVQNEYGKIINSSNGGTALTDSARHEAQALIDHNATVAQMIGSIKALGTEGDNRLLSVGDQIQRIQQRMKSPPKTETTNQNGISVTDPNGKIHQFQSQAQADAFKKLAGIP